MRDEPRNGCEGDYYPTISQHESEGVSALAMSSGTEKLTAEKQTGKWHGEFKRSALLFEFLKLYMVVYNLNANKRNLDHIVVSFSIYTQCR